MVWLLTGIWHGAKWTYIVWGMMYFVLLCVERILNLSGQKSWLGWIYTVFFFIAGNVVFRSENVTGALKYLLAMFNIHTTGLLDEKAVYYSQNIKCFCSSVWPLPCPLRSGCVLKQADVGHG